MGARVGAHAWSQMLAQTFLRKTAKFCYPATTKAKWQAPNRTPPLPFPPHKMHPSH